MDLPRVRDLPGDTGHVFEASFGRSRSNGTLWHKFVHSIRWYSKGLKTGRPHKILGDRPLILKLCNVSIWSEISSEILWLPFFIGVHFRHAERVHNLTLNGYPGIASFSMPSIWMTLPTLSLSVVKVSRTFSFYSCGVQCTIFLQQGF